jgi:transcriptional regulator with XRE-family HTH domain
LRKNAGLSAKRFSALLNIDPSHLSRIENGKRMFLGPPTDKLARFLAMAAIDQGYLQKALTGIADQRMESKKKVSKPPKPIFQLVRNHWKAAA